MSNAAYEDGYLAQRQGVKRSANPYLVTQDFNDWDAGWDAGCAEWEGDDDDE